MLGLGRGVVLPMYVCGDSGRAFLAEGVRPVDPDGGQAVCSLVQPPPDRLPREHPAGTLSLP
eukprot:2068235-Pyramimonas_sp.AAC.1